MQGIKVKTPEEKEDQAMTAKEDDPIDLLDKVEKLLADHAAGKDPWFKNPIETMRALVARCRAAEARLNNPVKDKKRGPNQYFNVPPGSGRGEADKKAPYEFGDGLCVDPPAEAVGDCYKLEMINRDTSEKLFECTFPAIGVTAYPIGLPVILIYKLLPEEIALLAKIGGQRCK
jgi:hypothetical protein